MNAENDDGLQINGVNVSLVDQITLSRIRKPIRSSTCHHIECFDYESFLEIYPQASYDSSEHIKCFICGNNVLFKDLYIDAFIQSMLVNTDSKSIYVSVNADGTLNTLLSDPNTKAKDILEISDAECDNSVIVID